MYTLGALARSCAPMGGGSGGGGGPSPVELPMEQREAICDDLDNFASCELRFVGNGKGWHAHALTVLIGLETVIYVAIIILGGVVVSIGWDAMHSKLSEEGESESISPVGMVIAGAAAAVMFFNMLRIQPARRLQGNPVAMDYLIKHQADYTSRSKLEYDTKKAAGN